MFKKFKKRKLLNMCLFFIYKKLKDIVTFYILPSSVNKTLIRFTLYQVLLTKR